MHGVFSVFAFYSFFLSAGFLQKVVEGFVKFSNNFETYLSYCVNFTGTSVDFRVNTDLKTSFF